MRSLPRNKDTRWTPDAKPDETRSRRLDSVEQTKRLKELEQENARLRRAVSDLTIDKLILGEIVRGKP